jgi:hypothetical protein
MRWALDLVAAPLQAIPTDQGRHHDHNLLKAMDIINLNTHPSMKNTLHRARDTVGHRLTTKPVDIRGIIMQAPKVKLRVTTLRHSNLRVMGVRDTVGRLRLNQEATPLMGSSIGEGRMGILRTRRLYRQVRRGAALMVA